MFFPMADRLLGVDAGTSRIKSLVFDPRGDEQFRSARDNPVLSPRSRWSEQDMEEIWEKTAETLREVTEKLEDTDRLVGVGITGQGDGCWFLDDRGRPLRNAVLWSDGRASEIIDRWQEEGIEDRLGEICGSRLFPGVSLAVLRWFKDHEPDLYRRIHTVFSCKDWIKYRLTGELTTDPTDASLPYLNVRTGEYDPRVGEIVGCPEVVDTLPPLASGTEVIGRVTPEASRRTGLPEGTPVISGMIDAVASAIGSGAAAPGDGSSVVGTTAINQSLMDGPHLEGDRVGYTFYVGESNLWVRTMASMAGTPNMDWTRGEWGQEISFEDMEEIAARAPIGSGGVMYHPYLSPAGERAPFVKTSARAQFSGLHREHTRSHLFRAVYEGVALAMKDCFVQIPVPSEQVYLSGGGARSLFWSQMFADALDTPINVPRGTEFGARGIALLLGIARGVFDDLSGAVEEFTAIRRIHPPRPWAADRYERMYGYYRDVYQTMFPIWDRRQNVYRSLAGGPDDTEE